MISCIWCMIFKLNDIPEVIPLSVYGGETTTCSLENNRNVQNNKLFQ